MVSTLKTETAIETRGSRRKKKTSKGKKPALLVRLIFLVALAIILYEAVSTLRQVFGS